MKAKGGGQMYEISDGKPEITGDLQGRGGRVMKETLSERRQMRSIIYLLLASLFLRAIDWF